MKTLGASADRGQLSRYPNMTIGCTHPLIPLSGEEADIIILSLVRNNTEGGGQGGIGFLKVSIFVHCTHCMAHDFSPSIAQTSRSRERNTA